MVVARRQAYGHQRVSLKGRMVAHSGIAMLVLRARVGLDAVG